MMPIDAAIVPFELNIMVGAAHLVHIREGEPSIPIHLFRSHVRLAGGKDDLVITPGGPRRRDQVHRIRPDEVLRQNEDGTYSIVPKDTPADREPKKQPKKEK